MQSAVRPKVLRSRRSAEAGKVTFVELFFDLVFVFAVTQLSHRLLEHWTLVGILQTGLLLMAVWWVWIFTSWVTNWLDPQSTSVRIMLFVLMLAGLILSTSIPDAFGSRGLAFAAAYAFMQVGRSVFTLCALRGRDPANYRNFQRITAWLLLAALFWIAGGMANGSARYALWALALLVEYVAPSLGFRTPGLGRSTIADWKVEGGHMAERCGLFIIIALGESILVTGATFGDLEWSATTIAAFATAFVGSVAMWWIYFNIGAEVAHQRISASTDPGRLARLAYTYIHLPIVAGIIVVAVADELVLAHPAGHIDAGTAAAILGGPALYLFGNFLFKRTMAGRVVLSHLGGLLFFAAIVPLVPIVTPLTLAALTSLVLVVVGAWETASLRSRGAETVEP